MTGIVGIKFSNSSKIYGFKKDDVEVKKGDTVVVESDLGMSLGKVIILDMVMEAKGREVKPVLRVATQEDLDKSKENKEKKEEARRFCIEKIAVRKLPMQLVDTDVTLDRKRIIFYFTAENRIDFRELVKDLASKFRTRIELRQIGVRDAAMIAGGYGICGREFCCKTWLRGFAPISIKMAKQQDLVLNTTKLSGCCGRLMCCLNYEYLTPEEKKERQAIEAKEAEERRLKEAEERKLKEAEEQELERLMKEEREVRDRERKAYEDRKRQEARAKEKPEDKQPEHKRHRHPKPHRRRVKPAHKASSEPKPPEQQAKKEGETEGQPKRKRRRRRRRPRKPKQSE